VECCPRVTSSVANVILRDHRILRLFFNVEVCFALVGPALRQTFYLSALYCTDFRCAYNVIVQAFGSPECAPA